MATEIEWTDETWNPVTGCNKVSPGCAHCYAEGIAKRFWGDRSFSDVQFHPDRLEQPFRWRKPRMVFVNSMSDLFHESVTFEQLFKIASVMLATPQHTYQVLTKRPGRMLELWPQVVDLLQSSVNGTTLNPPNISPLPNVWLGVTVENQRTADERIPQLLQTPAAVRFLSCEPLLEEIDLGLKLEEWLEGTVDWVIVGGESGPQARPCDIAWMRLIVEQCKAAGVPCFVKQLGSQPYLMEPEVIACQTVMVKTCVSATGKGNNPEEWPVDLRVREFPDVEG